MGNEGYRCAGRPIHRRTTKTRRKISLILVSMGGGPPHFDMFDSKLFGHAKNKAFRL